MVMEDDEMERGKVKGTAVFMRKETEDEA